ncbi:DMT family transporter [Mesorhizobium sp. VNQ89]|uniref:DMT family transporter n=1 Tax=Mesorhizobium quangtriensis TaxID=3157709 RepID=UPI0032B87CDC
MSGDTAIPHPLSVERRLGAMLVVASSAFFAMAGIFTKSISTDPWTIACWRGLVGGLLITGYVLWRSGPNGLRLDFGWRGWLMVAVGVAASLGFIASFKFTYVANVAVIYAATPLIAAFLEWIFLRERPRPFTLAMAVVCLLGVGIIVSGGIGGGNTFGDLVALCMTVSSAIYLVMIRAFRNSPVVWVGAVSAFILFAAGWLITDPLAVSTSDAWRMVGFGFTFACAVVLWTEGARLIPASESGVLGAAEVPFAILFAWIFLAELPPFMSIAGGAVVLTAVVLHALRARRAPPVLPVG